MMAETTPGQAEAATPEARQPSLPDRMARYGIWVAVVIRSLGDRRFVAGVVTAAIGAYALANLVKNNQARPVRRAAAWYTKAGASRELHRAEQALKPDKANAKTFPADHEQATQRR